ncbi:MAG: formate dehydrogenase accessory sulfurtransferase FdhD, partial [Opitutaceae bacterium]|nr:formate dehydrogenase accessory sulfurtransferase FdhD [Opitutaceae bacterium]
MTLKRWEGALHSDVQDVVAVEEPLEIRLGERALAVVMRTPGNDRELVAGFLATEGIVRHRNEILDLVHCSQESAAEPNVMTAHLSPGITTDWERLSRNTFASSSCGLCGKVSIDSIRSKALPLATASVPSRAVLQKITHGLRDRQHGFALTGGVHASGLFSADGDLIALREDVGRHNALDKVIGWALLADRLPLSECILVVSGRVSFELMQKALMAGIPTVAAVSAPTSLAVDFAVESGQ